jgi:predicted GNAT family acetyltransferase
MKALKEKRVADKTALYILYQGVDETGLEKVAGAIISKEAWAILQTAYKGAERVKQHLKREFESLKMKDSEGISDYITRVQIVTNHLKRNGENLIEMRIVEKILRSLTNAFENLVCAIKESKDLNELSIDEVAGSLMAHE